MIGKPDPQIQQASIAMTTPCCLFSCDNPLLRSGQLQPLLTKRDWHVGRDPVRRGITPRFKWLCPKRPWSGWDREEVRTSWPRCSSSSQGGRVSSPVCTDSGEAAAGAAAAAAVNESPGRDAACARSSPSLYCRHRPMAWVASEGRRRENKVVKLASDRQPACYNG